VMRGPEGLRLTPLGEAAMPLVEQVERAVGGVRDLASLRRKRVRVAVPSGFTTLLTPHLPRLQVENPQLSLELLSGARPVDLKKGEADLAVRIGPVSDPDLVVRKVCEAGWALYASRAYLERRGAPTDVDDLRGHHVIGYDASLARLPAAQWLEERSAKARVVMRCREMSDMLTATTSGLGLAVLSCWAADADPMLVRLTKEQVASRGVSLVYRREVRLSKEVRVVMRMIVDVLREQADRMG
jgi:DNA-binding transcriptional LysR family regulator